VKRAEKQRLQRAQEERARNAAEWLALKALLDRRIPESGRLVSDMKHPLFLNELRGHGSAPTGVTHVTDVVRRYAGVIAQRTNGDAQSVQRHFMELIAKKQAAKLGIDLGKLRVLEQSAPRSGMALSIKVGVREMVAVADYLVSPDHLNFGNLPSNPFGSPRVAAIMDRIKALYPRMRAAPEHEYTGSVGPTMYELRGWIEKNVNLVVNEISRTMPSNEARAAALKAMHLDDCLEIYTPGLVRQTGWHNMRVSGADQLTGQSVPVARRMPVYGIDPGAPAGPTRYRTKGIYGHNPGLRLLDFYDT
jgi:hypothetical protein